MIVLTKGVASRKEEGIKEAGEGFKTKEIVVLCQENSLMAIRN